MKERNLKVSDRRRNGSERLVSFARHKSSWLDHQDWEAGLASPDSLSSTYSRLPEVAPILCIFYTRT
jgi:hypothetical protein